MKRKKGYYGRRKDTWTPLKCKMVSVEFEGKGIGRKCDCNNCDNKQICGIPEIDKEAIRRLNKVLR